MAEMIPSPFASTILSEFTRAVTGDPRAKGDRTIIRLRASTSSVFFYLKFIVGHNSEHFAASSMKPSSFHNR
jgi:hypothetical protein